MAAVNNAKVLVVDDEYVLRQSIVAYLEDSGFTVIEADNGRVGLDICRLEKPEIVVSDIQMAEMDGLTFLSHVTREMPDVPFIVISGVGGLNEVIQALRLGAWDYVTKPIRDLAVLEHAVCRALERARLVSENKDYRLQLELSNQELKKNLATLEADQEAGRNVQMRLLPEQNFGIGDYTLSHRILPSLYLSGDFVDYFKINENMFAFYIADVSGHGASSAFITVLLKSIIGRISNRYQTRDDQMVLQPENVLSYVSSEIYNSQLGKYLTMIYGVVDKRDNNLTYSVGGHYPNPLLYQDNSVHFLEGKGFPVGIMKAAKYQRYVTTFEKNASLVMFSDGIMEIMPKIELGAKEDLLRAVVKEANAGVDSIMDCLGLKENRVLPDDVTILVLKRH